MKRINFLILFLISFLFAFSEVTPGVVKIYDESEIEALEESGVRIERRRGNILLCYFPYSAEGDIIITNDGEIDKNPQPVKIRTRSENPEEEGLLLDGKILESRYRRGIMRPTLDRAVDFYSARDIPEGKATGHPLTGSGVVVGICDIGIDPLHPTFLDEEGNSRIKRITHYKEFEGSRAVYEGNEDYAQWVTDSIEEYHATHVAGILAGRGAGTPFQGIATDSEIVVSVSGLTDFGLLMGVEDIIDYAKEAGKPAVINLSMGNYVGAHDGTSLFSQYLDMCADEAIIVLSAGNEGNHRNTLTYKFDEREKPLRFRLGSRDWSQREMYGITEIWSDSEVPFKVTIGIFDDENHQVVSEYESLNLQDGEIVAYQWNPEFPEFEGLSLDGHLIATGGINKENGRYQVTLMYDYKSTRRIGTGWAKDMVCVKVEGQSGNEVDVFADGTFTRLMSINGNPIPDSSMSISDLACGHRVVSVGMYGNRSTYPVTPTEFSEDQSTEKASGYEPMGTVVHSSYGTLRDGRALPLTVAPGIPLVSSISRPFIEAYPEIEHYLSAEGVPWFSIGGTSMSSPYVAGYIATWLEANPDLKVEDILALIRESNNHDIPEPEDPRNINGYFDPLTGLRKALELNGVGAIKNPLPLLLPSDKVEVFTLSGIRAYMGEARGCDQLSKGLYIIRTPYGVAKKSLPGLFR